MHAFITNKYLLVTTAICISIMLIPTQHREMFYLNLEFAQRGEYWRYITGHFTHYSWLHCISNLIGLFLLYGLFRKPTEKIKWLLPTAFIICVISFGLVISSESLKWYVGYSGVLIGLLSYTCISTFGQNALLSFAFLLLISTYVAGQTVLGGELIQSEFLSEINTSSYAHAFGLTAGLIYGLIESLKYCTLKYN